LIRSACSSKEGDAPEAAVRNDDPMAEFKPLGHVDHVWLQLAQCEAATVSDAVGGLVSSPRLDARTMALTRLACAIALPLDTATFRGLFDNCLAAGVEAPAVRDVIDAVWPLVGTVRTKEAVAHFDEVLATS
jgi:hypothetical protein